MIKRFLYFIACLFVCRLHAAQVANVEYVHNSIKQKWGIEVPYNADLDNPHVAANMKYLLTAVDVANEMLNGMCIGLYEDGKCFGNSDFATTVATDTVATDTAVETLIKKPEYKFFITTTETQTFSFKISAAGTFYLDWGDGILQIIKKSNTSEVAYSHTYDVPGVYNIGIGGKATAYPSSYNLAAISFKNNTNLAGISGSLGAVFSTLSSSGKPLFPSTFSGCKNLTGEIPPDLFEGVTGTPKYWMFNSTFYGCAGLTGQIPENLFSGIVGKPAGYMFYLTFSGCSGLSGAIPEKLFAGISGPPASVMFGHTFSGCSGLSGKIPENLFGGISGNPKNGMFYNTFSGCKKLTGIPENLFGNISGEAQSQMFMSMFSGCTGLVGPSARINGEYLYNIWPDATEGQVKDAYSNATKLDDYADIPAVWK